jgi:endonuclease III
VASARSQKAVMTRMYDRLGKAYGKRRRVGTGTMLEQLVLTILACDNKEPQALKALSILQREYVDWNEVRISPEEALCEDLSKADVNSGAPTMLKNTLEGLLLEVSSLKPEVLDECSSQEISSLLKRIDLPKSLSASLLLARSPLPSDSSVPLDSGIARVMVRAGLSKTARAKNDIKRRIRSIIPEDEIHNFHRVVGRLSREHCLNDPECARCPIKADCKHHRAHPVENSAPVSSRKPPARVRQAAAPRRSCHPSPKR